MHERLLQRDGWTLHTGDCREFLPTLDEGSVQCVVTSPPYWGLRDYGHGNQLGQERTPTAYVETLVEVFRYVRRVIADDGTLWLNLGDSYAGSWGAQSRSAPVDGISAGQIQAHPQRTRTGSTARTGLPAKNLVGIPWRVAFALQAEGWIVRSDIIWAKPNPMPESVTDRPTLAHEYVFLLTKQARYYYDAAAIREPLAESTRQRFQDRWDGANKRSVWTIHRSRFLGAHFATFPLALVEPCIVAGSRARDIVLDPFAGSGTTGLVALKHGRRFVGIELNPDYATMARERIAGPLFAGGVVA